MPFRRGRLRRLQAGQAFQQTAESLYLWPKSELRLQAEPPFFKIQGCDRAL